MTKRDIIIEVAEKTKQPQKEVRKIVEVTMSAIADSLIRGQDVELRNFGVFQIQIRSTRIGRNPNEPEKPLIIPEHAVIKFKIGKALRHRLANAGLVKPNRGTKPMPMPAATLVKAQKANTAAAKAIVKPEKTKKPS